MFMKTATLDSTPQIRWEDLLTQLGPAFSQRATQYDQANSFVKENYDQLKAHRFFALLVPEELGGAGLGYADTCQLVRSLAHYCSATALAFSMHQHLVAANVWRYKRGQGAEPFLRKVAAEQPVLVSTGAGDWLSSGGSMEKTEAGYLVTARKAFASQAPVGDMLVTSARYLDPEKGALVLHFPVPFKAEGLTIHKDWDTLGMRGTASHTVELNRVFVPDSAVTLSRPQGQFHPFWNAVLSAALPLIMSAYVGIAERATQVAGAHARQGPHTAYLLGELQNQLTTAQVLWQDMLRLANELQFEPLDRQGNAMLIRKTLVANACKATVAKAMEVVGGRSLFRRLELERLFRDVQGAPFHPLPEKSQHYFTGHLLQHGCFPADGAE
jgi:alkylation response protein AidB-like acyl-CoA dehydrogenase